MPTDDRRWTDADRELVRGALLQSFSAGTGFPDAVLDALTAAGWRNLRRISGYLIDGEVYDPRDVEILTRPERDTDAR